MSTFIRLMAAEFVKLRHSAAFRTAWILPLLFLGIEFLVFERPALSSHSLSPQYAATLESMQVKVVSSLWAGLFHPLLLAMLPALIFRPEHRYKQWRHLHAMPVSRRGIFLSKAVTLLLLCTGSLALIALGLWAERGLLGRLNPLLAFPFQGLDLLKVLGWLWLGSLPLLALYLWVSDRINSLAVPIVFGLLGMILTISLSGQDVPKPWKRDLIPWVLSYFSAQQALGSGDLRQQTHSAGLMFREEPDIIKLPNGKRVRTWQAVPDDVLFPPPPPTPAWVLATFSLCAGAALLGLGVFDAGRNRA